MVGRHPEPGAPDVHPGPRFHPEIRDLVPAEPLDEILADYDTWRNTSQKLCRKVVNRTAGVAVRQPGPLDQTQDLLFIEEAAGGIERFVEVGGKSADGRRAGHQTLKLPELARTVGGAQHRT